MKGRIMRRQERKKISWYKASIVQSLHILFCKTTKHKVLCSHPKDPATHKGGTSGTPWNILHWWEDLFPPCWLNAYTLWLKTTPWNVTKCLQWIFTPGFSLRWKNKIEDCLKLNKHSNVLTILEMQKCFQNDKLCFTPNYIYKHRNRETSNRNMEIKQCHSLSD